MLIMGVLLLYLFFLNYSHSFECKEIYSKIGVLNSEVTDANEAYDILYNYSKKYEQYFKLDRISLEYKEFSIIESDKLILDLPSNRIEGWVLANHALDKKGNIWLLLPCI